MVPVDHRGLDAISEHRNLSTTLRHRAAIYAGVSTADQSCERQVDELTACADRGKFEVVGIYKERLAPTTSS